MNADDKPAGATDPDDWKVERDIREHIRLEVPAEDRSKALEFLEDQGFTTTHHWISHVKGGRVSRLEFGAERRSSPRSVSIEPLDPDDAGSMLAELIQRDREGVARWLSGEDQRRPTDE